MSLRQRRSSGLQSSAMLSDRGGLAPETACPHAVSGPPFLVCCGSNPNEDEGADLSGSGVEPKCHDCGNGGRSRGILKYNCSQGGKRRQLYLFH